MLKRRYHLRMNNVDCMRSFIYKYVAGLHYVKDKSNGNVGNVTIAKTRLPVPLRYYRHHSLRKTEIYFTVEGLKVPKS